MLDPRALLTFYRVCQEGTISAAARVLNISQPSASSAIAALEARLGTPAAGPGCMTMKDRR
ncbi:MAG: LysR family transcriptional regulator [Novosphingobium sp.]